MGIVSCSYGVRDVVVLSCWLVIVRKIGLVRGPVCGMQAKDQMNRNIKHCIESILHRVVHSSNTIVCLRRKCVGIDE